MLGLALSEDSTIHTVTCVTSTINTSAAHHDIVADAKAALAGDEIALTVAYLTIRQHSGLVELQSFVMESHCLPDFLGVEEVP